jgi:predicted phosphodiesterase
MGEKRGPYAYSVSELIQAQGVTDLFDTSQNGDAACPLNSDPVAAPIVSSAPAAVGDSGRFVVISDTNSSYGSTGQSKQVGTAIQTIIGIKPAFVIHNGDMIAGGKEKNYDEAKMNKMWGGYQSEISDPLSQAGIALFPVAGNHDLTKTADTYGSFWLQRKPQTEVTSGYPKNYTFEYNGWHFVMLYAPNGDRAEASWLESDLNANKNKNILVFSHYPVIPLCSQGSAYNTGLLTQTFSVLQKFSRDNPGKLKGYFHGHSHIFHDGVESGVRVISTGHLSTDGCTAANANDSTGPSFIVVDLNSSGVVTVSRSST